MHHLTFRRNTLALALSAALLLPLAAVAQSTTTDANGQATQQQQPANPPPSSAQPQTLQKVTVLGSLIPRAEIEGSQPVQIVTGAQIKAQGYTTLFQFMESLPQTSGNSDFYNRPSTWGNTAVNARTVDLRGLGPQFTLLMIDGHPVVNYPQPENASFGHFDLQNVNNIPLGMIDRIEILPTGASAIYGSQAMAGVVNIILKKQYQGDDLQLQAGGDTRGGQNYGDFMWTGGRSGNNWHIVYNYEHTNRSPLWGMDRPNFDAVNDAGYGTWNPSDRMFGYQYNQAGGYGIFMTGANGNFITPPAGSCEAFPSFVRAEAKTVGTSGDQVTGPVTDQGTYCAQPHVFQDWTLEPGIRNDNFYVAGQYDINPTLSVYGSMALYLNHGWTNTQLPEFASGVFYDAGTGQVVNDYYRQLTVSELGAMGNTYDNEKYWDIRAGVKGAIFDDRFNWDLEFGSQKYLVHENYTAYNDTAMQNFFLGPQLGTTTVTGANAAVCPNNETSCQIPVYNPNQQTLWYPITPTQYAIFSAAGQDNSASVLDNASLNVNGDLFNVPWNGKPIGWAAVLDADHESFELNPDPRLTTVPNFYNPFFDNNKGGGTRQHYDLGTEFRVPVFDTLTWDIAGRIDKYHDASVADIARTWKTGIEWRPVNGLLLRGSYGTNFRAPGLDDIYLADTVSTVGDYADDLKCIQQHITVCPDTQHPPSEYFPDYGGGNKQLLPMTGHTWTYGFVWSIPHVQGLSVSADYWHLTIDNEIEWIGIDTELTDEAGCLTGLQVSGAPYTAHALGSPYCQEAIANVTRDANGNIIGVHTGPINESYQSVSGVDAEVDYAWQTENLGDFKFQLNYTNNLDWYSRTLATDPLINTRNQHVETRMTASLAWDRGPWNATLYGLRWGGVEAPNYNGCETLANGIQPGAGDPECVIYKGNVKPWVIFSGSVGYQFDKRVKMTLNVTNIFDKVGTIEPYAGGFEYISTGQGQDYTGRQVFLTINYKLD